MYQFKDGQVVRNGYSTIPYTWIHNEKGNKSICIMLPGLGYTTQRPLFHYATSMCLNHQIDILHVNYQFAKNEHFTRLSKEKQDRWMYEDVKAVVEEILTGTNYEQCFLLCKSIGTIPMALEWTHKNFIQNPFGIWLTPLLKEDNVYETLVKTELPSLCIIGDQDHHFINERVTALKKNEHISTVIIPGADHSLEIQGDVSASIEAVKIMVDSVQDFIRSHRI
ncbi:alpha/beta family hydrolase [Neobacillus drentensis]|uniref:alpha/beta family hydrolase n=1 Tax=Neobacillus drentensis TaxID=220684 RepID=UPI0030038F32